MEECLFCKIIKGKVDSLKLYEDDDILVMLDAYPDSPGHTLIIPKKHYLDLSDMPIELLDKILLKAKDIKSYKYCTYSKQWRKTKNKALPLTYNSLL